MPTDSHAPAPNADALISEYPILEQDGITYRILPVGDWHRIIPLYEELFGTLPIFPNPLLGSILAAEDAERNVVGFCFLQSVLHAEPVGKAPGSSVNIAPFKQLIDSRLPHGTVYYVFVPADSTAEAAAQKLGLQKWEGMGVFTGAADETR